MSPVKRQRWYVLCFALLLGGLASMVLCNICIGSVSIPARELVKCLTGQETDPVWAGIILNIRLPRTLAAGLLGGSLALSGYLLQSFFHNPIAGPFVLGISSGSKLAVAVVMVLATANRLPSSSTLLIGFAFAGAMISMGFVLLLSRKVDNMSSLVVGGVMTGYICSAVTDFIVTFADDANIVNLHNWSKGSFSGMSWANMPAMWATVMAAVVMVFLLSKPIGAYGLGEAYAENMGVNVRLLRIYLVILSSILSACVAAYAGPVSFVGIAVPHLARNLFKTNEPIVMIPACFLSGGLFCLVCDLIARTMFAPTELSISTVTAVLGGPVVLWVMAGRRDRT